MINSVQAQQLAWRTGLTSRVIPNVMEFENPPPPPDRYARNARRDLGVAQGDFFILQPTRIVQRKGIEHAIELTRRLGLPATLVISHAGDDEGTDYEQRVREFAQLLRGGRPLRGRPRGRPARIAAGREARLRPRRRASRMQTW